VAYNKGWQTREEKKRNLCKREKKQIIRRCRDCDESREKVRAAAVTDTWEKIEEFWRQNTCMSGAWKKEKQEKLSRCTKMFWREKLGGCGKGRGLADGTREGKHSKRGRGKRKKNEKL